MVRRHSILHILCNHDWWTEIVQTMSVVVTNPKAEKGKKSEEECE